MDWNWLPIVIAAIGSLYQVLSYYQAKRATGQGAIAMKSPYVIPGVIMLLTWGAVAYDLYDRRYIQSITIAASNEEIADTIGKWLNRFHLQVQKEDREGTHFSFVVRGQDGVPVTVMRLGKEREQFITFLGRVFISAGDQVRLKALSDQQRERFYREITIELARQKTSAAVEISQITIETRIPLTELTEAKLLDRLDEVNYAVKMVIAKIRLLLDPQQ
jgi:hypothetical protein